MQKNKELKKIETMFEVIEKERIYIKGKHKISTKFVLVKKIILIVVHIDDLLLFFPNMFT